MRTLLLPALIALLAPMAQAAPPRTVTSGGWAVSWNDQEASATKAAKTVPIFKGVDTEPDAAQNDGQSEQSIFTLRSIVGSCICFHDYEYANLGGAHPEVSQTFKALDLETQAPVLLTDFFPEPQIVSALLSDGVIAKARTKRTGVRSPRTLAELCAQLDGGCELDLSPMSLDGSFIFHHLEGDKVAIRIGVTHACPAARGLFTQLGLLLPIPPSLKAALIEADRQKTLGIHLRARK